MDRCALSLFYNVFSYCQEVLNTESFFTEISIKPKRKIIGEFGPTLGIVGNPLSDQDFMKVIWKFLDLRCGRFLILSNICH
jgi:hypothetical protein